MADSRTIDRRRFLGASVATTAAALAGTQAEAQMVTPPQDALDTQVRLSLTINAQQHDVVIDSRVTLLDLMRERLGLTGSKKGCDHGQCGACTVLAGGRPVLACLTLAAGVRDEVTTIEGLAGADGVLHPMQEAFLQHDAFQCGYCTPGQILSAVACVHEKHAASDAQIREYMSGNICRCAAYPNIVAAVKEAKSRMEQA